MLVVKDGYQVRHAGECPLPFFFGPDERLLGLFALGDIPYYSNGSQTAATVCESVRGDLTGERRTVRSLVSDLSDVTARPLAFPKQGRQLGLIRREHIVPGETYHLLLGTLEHPAGCRVGRENGTFSRRVSEDDSIKAVLKECAVALLAGLQRLFVLLEITKEYLVRVLQSGLDRGLVKEEERGDLEQVADHVEV